MPQHFVAPPEWHWYIVWYFFLGGIAGGAYVLGTLLRLLGEPRDQAVSRIAFLVSFPAVAICPILLTLDLGRPERFLHMLIDPQRLTLNFKYWSPMSVGAWVLLIFSVFAFVSFLEALVQGALARWLSGGLGHIVTLVGGVFGLFLAGYTGVLLSVSNQPIWSDTWTLGGLFLASGLSVAAATLALLASSHAATEAKLSRADRYFILLELALLVLFFVTLGAVGGALIRGPLALLWLLVLAGTLLPLAIHRRSTSARRLPSMVTAVLVLIGGFALRVIVIFAPQL